MINNRKGFTLIELLIVVVIIGILAAIAIPKFAQTKDKARIAAAKSEVRNLMTSLEGYYADHQTYAGFPIPPATASGVTLNVSPMTAAGYTATGQVDVSGGTSTCTVNVGNTATATAPDGVIDCITAAPTP